MNPEQDDYTSSAQINLVISILLSREDLRESITSICIDSGFNIEDLLPRGAEDFGGSETPSIIKALRFRNFENKRTKRTIKLLRELKNRRILFINKSELVQNNKEMSQISESKKPSMSYATKATDIRVNAYANAHVNVIVKTRDRLKQLSAKEKSNQIALDKVRTQKESKSLQFLKREEIRKEITEKRLKEIELKEKHEIQKQFRIKTPARSISIDRPSQMRSVKREKPENTSYELESIINKLEEGAKRSINAKAEISKNAARSFDAEKAHNYRKNKEKKLYDYAQWLSQSINYKIKHSEENRKRIISSSINKLHRENEIKVKKVEESKRKFNDFLEEKEKQVVDKDRNSRERIKKLKKDRDFHLFVASEKRSIKKLNQIEKAREDEHVIRMKKQTLFNKLFESSVTPDNKCRSLSPVFQESLTSTKLNTSKILARLRKRGLGL